ncbi:MAG TPA: 1,4-dihydroxy-2-naphthoate octaprenyltransferase [Clostridiales bacterium]|nr:1,4-dihydroxy-2-naphthoate octaprenyltransferase [Clostridiales bacterium]
MNEKAYLLNKGFWQVADPKIWIASTVPLVLGVMMSVLYTGEFHFLWMILSFIGVYFIETGKNAINECVDYASGADRCVDKEHRTSFSGGKKTIVDGVLTWGQSAWIGFGTIIAAAFIGVIIVFFKEPKVLWIGLAGLMLAVFYSLPPFKLIYRGLGEIVVGIAFGPLIINGMYVVMSGRFDVLPLLVSVPVGWLIIGVLWINQYPDYEADMKSGKKNGLVRIGKQKGVTVYGLIFALTYLSVIPIMVYTKNVIWLITWLTVPMAIKAVKNCAANKDEMTKLVSSNADTIKIYILNGLLLCVSMFIDVI